MRRPLAPLFVAGVALSIGVSACDLFEPEPTFSSFPLPDKPDDPRACAGPGSAIELPGETIPPVYMRASEPDLACSGEWLADDYLAPTWTTSIGEQLDLVWQLAPHPEGGVVVLQSNTLVRIDGEGQPLWSRSGIAQDAEYHVLRVDEQGRIFAAARLDTDLDILVFDPEGNLTHTIALPGYGRSGHGHFTTFEGDLLIAVNDNEIGPVLLRTTIEGERVFTHALEQSAWLPFVHVDGAGTLYYGDEPGRLLASDGKLITQLDASIDVEGTWVDAHRSVAPRELGFLVAQDEVAPDWSYRHLGVRALDSEGGTSWQARRSRGEFASFARSIASTPEGGGVVVGYETFDDRLSGYDSFVTFVQPVVVGFGPEGELRWVDRIAVGGQALDVVVGSQGEVYVTGTAEFRNEDALEGDPYQLRWSQWLRRYDPA